MIDEINNDMINVIFILNENIQQCYVTLSIIRMKYFVSEKLEIKLFEFSKVFSLFIILKCKNLSCCLNFYIN